MRYDTSLQVIEVAPFSDAYFDLVRNLPALGQYLALGDDMVIAGDDLALKLSPDGVTTWNRNELRSVLQAFEGSL
jgi:hypothetical protein